MGGGISHASMGRRSRLVVPTENDPVAALEFFKPKGGDIFREVREDGSEAEELKFTRDASGKVTGYIQSSNPKLRMPRLTSRGRQCPKRPRPRPRRCWDCVGQLIKQERCRSLRECEASLRAVVSGWSENVPISTPNVATV